MEAEEGPLRERSGRRPQGLGRGPKKKARVPSDVGGIRATSPWGLPTQSWAVSRGRHPDASEDVGPSGRAARRPGSRQAPTRALRGRCRMHGR